jgi:hypothetical protein
VFRGGSNKIDLSSFSSLVAQNSLDLVGDSCNTRQQRLVDGSMIHWPFLFSQEEQARFERVFERRKSEFLWLWVLLGQSCEVCLQPSGHSIDSLNDRTKVFCALERQVTLRIAQTQTRKAA